MLPPDHLYCSCFCEENVFHLCASLPPSGHVVFVSNERETVAIRHQRSGSPPDGRVVWDYHVFAVADGCLFDLDSTLSWGTSVDTALPLCFPADEHPMLQPKFRVVPASEYVSTFSSDRQHMRNTFTGVFQSGSCSHVDRTGAPAVHSFPPPPLTPQANGCHHPLNGPVLSTGLTICTLFVPCLTTMGLARWLTVWKLACAIFPKHVYDRDDVCLLLTMVKAHWLTLWKRFFLCLLT